MSEKPVIPNSQSATIADIARRAGVGTATVDRVINSRPGVNAGTMGKVMEAVNALGQPPLMRGRPRRKGNFRFCYVLPATNSDFFDLIERLIAQVAGELRHLHVTHITHRINLDNPACVAAELAQIKGCDGLILVAPDLPAVKLAINEKAREGIHVVTLFSDVAGSLRSAYIGADNRASGRTAGLLMAKIATQQRNTLLLLSQATRMSGEIERQIGFSQVLEDRFASLKLERCLDLPANPDQATEALQAFLQTVDVKRLVGAYLVGGATSGIAQALSSLSRPRPLPWVVHDLTEAHQAMLVDGSLSYVLNQDIHYCVLTAARVLKGLCENVRGALGVVQPRIEILTAENLH